MVMFGIEFSLRCNCVVEPFTEFHRNMASLFELLPHLYGLVLHLSLFTQCGAVAYSESVACELCAKHLDAQMVRYKHKK